ncbi:hypothetical protein [Microcoleus sp. B7-D4]|uniref:hypothetical protein n=1 Tax=Microcoleus sp. B7-D4 TaxID=2818696 RepID=UPI002FD533C7
MFEKKQKLLPDHCPLPTAHCPQSTVNSQQSTVNSQQSTVNSQQSTVNRLLYQLIPIAELESATIVAAEVN